MHWRRTDLCAIQVSLLLDQFFLVFWSLWIVLIFFAESLAARKNALNQSQWCKSNCPSQNIEKESFLSLIDNHFLELLSIRERTVWLCLISKLLIFNLEIYLFHQHDNRKFWLYKWCDFLSPDAVVKAIFYLQNYSIILIN